MQLAYEVFDEAPPAAPQQHGQLQELLPVVAVHGLLSDRSSLRPLCRLLAASAAAVYLVDLPFHGASSAPSAEEGDRWPPEEEGAPAPPPVSERRFAAALLRLLEGLRLSRCLLLGHSLGGQVCMRAALLEAERRRREEGRGGAAPLVAAVCALDILPLNYFHLPQPLPAVAGALNIVQLMRLLAALDVSGLQSKQQAVQLLLQQHPPMSTQQAEGALALLQEETQGEEGPPTLKWRMQVGPLSEALLSQELCWDGPSLPEAPQQQQQPQQQELCAFEGPLLVVRGSESLWVSPSAFEAHAKPLFPKARLETIQGASHSPHKDNPQAVAQLLPQGPPEAPGRVPPAVRGAPSTPRY
ncbi:hypothetical protein Efla_007457 [Eimeria flavescens]